MLPKLDGIAFRFFQGEPDYKPLAEIETASNTANQIEEVRTPEEVAHEFAHPVGMNPTMDVLVAEAEGVPVGFTKVHWRITAENERLYWQWGHVKPEWTRKGIGRSLLAFTEGRARAHAAANPHNGPSHLRGVGEDTAYGKIALFEQNQYPVVRYFCFMQRKDLNDLLEAQLPPGLEFRPAERAHLRQIWEAKEDAFRDHWGYAPKTEDDYWAWLENPDNKLHLWQIVWDKSKNEVAAVSLNEIMEQDNALYNFKRGWVSFLGVRRAYRKTGVATAMLWNGMQNLREHGMTEAVLGVDAENPHNALRLYEGVGFKVINKDALYQKPI